MQYSVKKSEAYSKITNLKKTNKAHKNPRRGDMVQKKYEIEREREGSPQNSIEGDRERGATRVLGGFWERERQRLRQSEESKRRK